MTRVAILQSNYIPWKGYFDLIHDADAFVFLDDVQYTTRDWRNRNRIKTDRGAVWLTIPVGHSTARRISDVQLPTDWGTSHWNQLRRWYARAPFFAQFRELLEAVYLERTWTFLSELNQFLIRAIASILGITTKFYDSREFTPRGQGQERLLDILQKMNARTYISGPAAKAYIEPSRFADAGIELIWKDYAGYPEYPQFHPPFTHAVTVLDLLFHTGPRAAWHIWGWRESQ